MWENQTLMSSTWCTYTYKQDNIKKPMFILNNFCNLQEDNTKKQPKKKRLILNKFCDLQENNTKKKLVLNNFHNLEIWNILVELHMVEGKVTKFMETKVIIN